MIITHQGWNGFVNSVVIATALGILVMAAASKALEINQILSRMKIAPNTDQEKMPKLDPDISIELPRILPEDILAEGFEIKEQQISEIDNEEDRFDDKDLEDYIPDLWTDSEKPSAASPNKRKSAFKIGFDMNDFEEGLQQIQEVSESDLTTVKSLGHSGISLSSFQKNRKTRLGLDPNDLASPSFKPKSRFLGGKAPSDLSNKLGSE